MSKFGLIFTALILALSMEVFAQRHNEFAGIPFGATREAVIEEVMKMGYETYNVGGREQIPVYRFGELPVQVDFIFNRNDKFYAFEIRTGRVEEARKTKVFEAVEYMSEQFTLKYGKPSGEPAVNDANIRTGRNIYQEWYGVKTLNAATSVHKAGDRFFAVGVVENRVLSKESAPQKKSKSKTTATPAF